MPTKWDETELNRLQARLGQLLNTAVVPRLVPDGKRGRCRCHPPPSRLHHPTEDSDDSPPLGWLDEAGSPSPSVFVLPVPGSPEFRRGPRPALVRSLSYVNRAARTFAEERPYGQTGGEAGVRVITRQQLRTPVMLPHKSNIVGLSRLINLGTWPTIWARHRLGILTGDHHMPPLSIAELLRREPATVDPMQHGLTSHAVQLRYFCCTHQVIHRGGE